MILINLVDKIDNKITVVSKNLQLNHSEKVAN